MRIGLPRGTASALDHGGRRGSFGRELGRHAQRSVIRAWVQALRVRSRVVFEYGRWCKLQDFDGREYLDMVAGIAVMALGTGRSSL